MQRQTAHLAVVQADAELATFYPRCKLKAFDIAMALQTGTRRSASLFQLDPRFGEEKLIGSTAAGDSIFDRTAVVFCYLQCGGDRQCEYRSRRVPAALCLVALGPSRHCGGSRLELCGVFGFTWRRAC